MAELQFPDIQGAYMRGHAFGTQQRLQREGEERRNRLNELSSQAYTAAPDQQGALLSQMAAVSPEAAATQQQQFQGQEDRRLAKLGGAARYLETARQSGDVAKVQGAWNAVRPMLQREFPEGQFADAWDDAAMAPVLYQALAATGGASVGNVQSVRVGDDGYYYNVMRNGQVVNTGVRSAPNIQVIQQPGQTPYGVTTSNGVAGATVNLGPRGTAGGAPGAPAGGGFPSAPIVANNAQGRPAASLQLDGVSPEVQQRMARTIAMMTESGYSDSEIEAWLASQMGQTRDVSPQQFGMPSPTAGPVPTRIPTAAETAYDSQMAKNAADFAAYDQMTQKVVTREAATSAAQAQAKSAVERGDTQRERDNALRVYETAIKGLTEGLAGTDTGPLMGRLPAVTTGQQIAEGGIAAMAPILKQLFRAAGEGAFTNDDQKLLMAMLPTRTDTPAARESKISNINAIVRAKLNAPPTGAQPQGSQASAPQAAASRPQTDADFAALPSGALYVDPDDGRTYRKP